MFNKKIITISRQFGSGGRQIGEKLADALSVPFYDNNLISIAAKESGFSEEFFEHADENQGYGISSLLMNLGCSSNLFGMTLNEKIFLIQSKTILELAAAGPCVIVGRCADFVLKDREDCINLFIFSNKEARIRRAVEEYKISPERPWEEIQKIDKRRENYYSFFTKGKWGVLENYHLALNSDSIGIDNSVKLILDYLKMKSDLQ